MMKRRTLLILALSMLLVIPALVAAAASGFDAETPVATVNQERVQDQSSDCGECLYESVDRDRDRVQDQDRTNAPDVAADRTQIQAQNQLRIHDPASGEAGEQAQLRAHEQRRDEANCDGDGMQLREHVRTEAQVELTSSERQSEPQGYGFGAEAGNGPLHEEPADGTGNQFGRGDR